MKTYLQFERKIMSVALQLLLIAAFAGMAMTGWSQSSATITTDLQDYPPGATVIITGSGFQPGESVTLLVEHEGEDPTGTDPVYHQPWSVNADVEGNVVTSWYVPEDGDALGATFLLTADGQTSGLHAETHFTDANLNQVDVLAQVGSLTYGTAGTVTYTVNVKATGGAGAFTATLSATGLPSGVTASFSPSSLPFPNATTLSSTLTLTTLSTTSAALSPYTFTVTATNGPSNRSGNGTLTIAKRVITGGITGVNKEYDGTSAATVTSSFNGIIAGDNVTVSVGSASFNSKDVGTGKSISAIVTLSGTAAGNYTGTSPAITTADITAKQLTPAFTASNKVYDGNTTATILTRSLAGVVGSENVSLVGGTANFDTKDAGTGKTVTGTGFTLSGNAGTLANYLLSPIPPTTTANIEKKGIVVTAGSSTKAYGSPDPFFTYSTPSGSLAPGDGVTGGLTRVAGENVGNYAVIVDVSNPIAIDPVESIPNYTVSFVPGSLAITPVPLTITAGNKTKVYDGLLFSPFTVAYNGFVNGEDENALGGALTFSGTATTNASFGNNYKIIPNGLTSTNYTITYVQGALNITKRPISIIVNALQTKVYGNVDPTFTYSVGGDGLAITDEFTGALGRVAGENVSSYLINQGTLTISNSTTLASVSNNYTVTFISANFTITTLPVNVTAEGKTKLYGAIDPTLTFVSIPAVGSTLANGIDVSFTGTLTRDAGETVGSYAIRQGNVANSNYAIAYTGANLSINQLPVTITADTKNKTYGDLDPALTFLSNPLVGSVLPNGLSISFIGSLARDAGEEIGNYAINQGDVANGNYSIVYTGANLSIHPLGVTVTADADTKTYGDVDPTLTFVSVPAVGSTLANGLTIGFTGLLSRDAGETVGNYVINQGNVANNNYTIVYTAALLLINPLDVTVTADAKAKTYGDVDPSLTFVSVPAVGSALANGLIVSFTGSLTREAGEIVGSYPIKQGEVANSNYTIVYTAALLSINPLNVTATADAKAKTYGDVDPALTFVSVPAVGSALANGLIISFTGSLTREAGETVGSYPIKQGDVANSNYTIVYTAALLSINPLNVTVTADAKAKTYGDVDPALTFVSVPAVGSALANGLIVGFTGSLTRDVGETVGSYPIKQGDVANSNYSIAYTGANLSINPLGVTVTADAKVKTYGDVDPSLTFVSVPAVGSALANGLIVSFTGSLARDAGEDIGNYAIKQGDVANINYSIVYTGANLSISPLGVTVTADAKAKTYGDVDPALTFVSVPAVGSALPNGLIINFTGSLTRDAGETVGGYAIKQGAVANSNYTIVYTGANLTINPASLQITANNRTKYCGQGVTFAGTEFSVVGLTYSDAVTSVTLASVGAPWNALASGSPYTITPSLAVGTGLSNYTISYVNGSLNILAVSIDASANSTPQAIKSTPTILTASITPAVAGVTVAFKVDGVLKGSSLTSAAGIASFDIGVLAADVYKIEVLAGADCSTSTAYLPVYDPNGGFVTGGGWFTSPVITSLPYMQVSGKANFGFVSKYLKGSNTPTGNTEFQFQAGNLNFASSTYNLGSLVVAGSQAIYKGVGKINDAGNYGFMVSAVDGNISGGGGYDKFRIKIWDIGNGTIVYDNNNGLDENGTPTTAIGGGSIVIHDAKSKSSTARTAADVPPTSEVELDETISVDVYPNPMRNTLSVKLANPTNEATSIQMLDVTGKGIILKQSASSSDGIYTLDTTPLPSGLYILQLKVGRFRKTVKLLKE